MTDPEIWIIERWTKQLMRTAGAAGQLFGELESEGLQFARCHDCAAAAWQAPLRARSAALDLIPTQEVCVLASIRACVPRIWNNFSCLMRKLEVVSFHSDFIALHTCSALTFPVLVGQDGM